MLWSPETDADRYVDGTHIRKRGLLRIL